MTQSPPTGDRTASLQAPAIRRVSRDEALGMWHQLLRGDWTIVDRLDDGNGRSFVLARFEGREEPRPWHRLSPRERSVVAAVAAGHSNRQIASALGISVSTGAGHLRAACRKLGGARRLDLVREWSSAFATEGLRVMDLRVSSVREAFSPLGVGAAQALPPGLLVFRIEVAGVLLALFSYEVSRSAELPSLSDAERAVVCAILHGKTNAEIAAERSTAPRTVANQVASVFQKMGVRSRAELAARYGLER